MHCSQLTWRSQWRPSSSVVKEEGGGRELASWNFAQGKAVRGERARSHGTPPAQSTSWQSRQGEITARVEGGSTRSCRASIAENRRLEQVQRGEEEEEEKEEEGRGDSQVGLYEATKLGT